MARTAIVVLNWNGITDTLQCLDSLLLLNSKDYHILVVDNGSSDGSKEELDNYSTKHKIISVLYNKQNLGFTGGVNTGIRWALKNNFEYIALFNNDARADSSWLTELIKAIQPEEVGISTGLLLHEDGETIDSTGDWYSKWGLPFPRNRNDKSNYAPKGGFVFGASGGASLYKAALLRDIGLFDENFFAYYEDVDISFRSQLAGWKVYYNPAAVAYHKQGASSKKQVHGFAVYQTFKNLPILFMKNMPRNLLIQTGIRFYSAYWLMYLNALMSGNGLSATKGVIKSLLLTPDTFRSRRFIQKNTRASSSYIQSILWDDLPPDQTGIRKVRRVLTGK